MKIRCLHIFGHNVYISNNFRRATQRLIEESELGIYGCARKGGQTQQVFLKQGDVRLFVHCRHTLCKGNEEENSAYFLQLPGEHLKNLVIVINFPCVKCIQLCVSNIYKPFLQKE